MKNKRILLITFIILIILIISLSIFLSVHFNKTDDTKANMEFVINDTLQDGNNKKVKVILLGGQSNASGCSHISELSKNIDSTKMLEYEKGYENIYINYYDDNSNNKSDGFVNVKIGQGANIQLFGPELGMGEKLSELYPNETIFIIKYAWGGSNLHTQWNPNGGKLYQAFIKFTKESMEYLKSKNYDAKIVSMMWMQGESDANQYYAHEYEDNLLDMIGSIRSSLKEYIAREGMYFIDAYISDSPFWRSYVKINKAKSNVCNKSDLNICIDTIKEGLTYDKEPVSSPDLAHYDSISEIKLGHLFIDVFNSNQ